MRDQASTPAFPEACLPGGSDAGGSVGSGSGLTDVLYLQEPGGTSPISTADIHQNGIGDCYLLSAIGELALLHPNMIENMIRVNANGTETVSLYGDASGSAPGFDTSSFSAVQVTVDNLFDPDSVNSQPGQDSYAGQQEIWVQVLEKALATTVGGYGVVDQGGYPTLAMEQLTGQQANFYATGSLTLGQLQADMAAGDLITFDTPQSTALANDPLVLDHAYMLGGLIDQGGTEMVQLLNPWGPSYNPAPIAFSQIAAYSDYVAVGLAVDTAPPLVGAPPAPTGLALAAGSDSGIAGDDLTNVTTPTITGLAQPGDIVTLFAGTSLAGRATAGEDGRWSITAAPLQPGTVIFTATDTNATGVASGLSTTLTLAIDVAAPPAPSGLSASAGGVALAGPISRTDSLTISGIGSAGDVVTLRDAGQAIGTAVVGAGGRWSLQATGLADGSHGFSATETDAAGNVSAASGTLSLVVDTAAVVAPVVQGVTLNAAGAVMALAGVAGPGASVTLYDDGAALGTVPAGTQSGAWSFALAAALTAPGDHRITAVATDTAGAPSAPSGALDIEVGASGAETISASTGGLAFSGGAAPIWFEGGVAASSVAGGAGSVTVFGGSGGGVFTGGSAGGNVLVSQGSSGVLTRLTGAGSGDLLFGSAGGSDQMLAGSGREMLIAGGGPTTQQGGTGIDTIFAGAGSGSVSGGSAGGDTIVGGTGALTVAAQHGDAIFGTGGSLNVTGSATGADSIIAGASTLDVVGRGGNMLVAAGNNAATIQTGNGASLVFAGSGNLTLDGGAGAMQVVAGAGNTTITEGAGGLTLQVVAGSAGGSTLVDGFRPGTDRIELFGFAPGQGTAALSGGSTVLSLADGTRITLQGVSNLDGSLLG